MWAHYAYQTGDIITRSIGGQQDAVTLPPIDLFHLRSVHVDRSRVRGFHILPETVVVIRSMASFILPSGAIPLLDDRGAPIVGARLRLKPTRVPVDGFDAFEARVEVLDSTGIALAADASKSFYPQAWTEWQIQQAIYSAYADHYRAGGN